MVPFGSSPRGLLSSSDVDDLSAYARSRASAPPVLVPEASLTSYFQPIVSLRTGRSWGTEALARATHETLGTPLPPLDLFRNAEERGLLLELDRFCRRSAIELFAQSGADRDLLLSLNWDTRTLRRFDTDPAQLERVADRYGIPRGNIILEILERRVDDLDALVRFAQKRRREGFLIAVDDFGTGHSSAERLVRIEPDIVKIDRSLVQGVSTSHPRREACRSIAELARSIGAIVIAEGVEEDADLVELAMLGIDLFQGFLLARPGPDVKVVSAAAERAIEDKRGLLRARAERELLDRRENRRQHETTLVSIVTRLAHAGLPELDTAAEQALAAVSGLEALYVLDQRGVQLTNTWLQPGLVPRTGFRPTSAGADLGLKEYFLEVAHGAAAYASRPYVSMASGRLCVTHSRRVKLIDGSVVVVCCDLPSNTLE